jgi:hypothetical protein
MNDLLIVSAFGIRSVSVGRTFERVVSPSGVEQATSLRLASVVL